jgi:hypothetical protein
MKFHRTQLSQADSCSNGYRRHRFGGSNTKPVSVTTESSATLYTATLMVYWQCRQGPGDTEQYEDPVPQ